ncbi:MAG: hypothetical protein ABI839_01095 [Verrucomicrobiota bacterium]
MIGRNLASLLLVLSVAGCAATNAPRPGRLPAAARSPSLPAADQISVAELTAQITALAPTVNPSEARRVAVCAHNTVHQLKIDYAMVGPPLFQNFLINVGIKNRGFCYQWATDLMSELDALNVKTIKLHWGVAHRGGLREHNCVVVTATRQAFAQGLVLDGWRYGGRLYFGPVATDRYPWKEEFWDWRHHR